jgi:predicted phosphodiesterase
MNKPTVDRSTVMKVLEESIQHLQKDQPRTRSAGMAQLGARSETTWRSQRDDLVERLQRARERASDQKEAAAARQARTRAPVTEDPWYLPRDRTIALVQSAMDEHIEQKAAKLARAAKKSPAARAQARALFEEKFDTTDPGWATVLFEQAKALFKGKAKFIKHKSVTDFRFPLAPNARVALLADWGAGNDYAQHVAEQVKARNPDHVIHLGDVYYSGTESEIKNRFLKYWPYPADGGRSWALNSNHEMYSGGHAYFKLTLKTFKQPASYFSLENENWRFIGLDTGYVEHNLNKEQADWLKGQLGRGKAKSVLMSHHQLFSAFEGQGVHLQEWLQPHLDEGRIDGWFWGHEHSSQVYEPFMGIKARCIGNGCIPYGLPSNPVPHPEVPIKWVDRRPNPDHPKRGMHGYALITLDGANAQVEYIDLNGVVAFQEDL